MHIIIYNARKLNVELWLTAQLTVLESSQLWSLSVVLCSSDYVCDSRMQYIRVVILRF